LSILSTKRGALDTTTFSSMSTPQVGAGRPPGGKSGVTPVRRGERPQELAASTGTTSNGRRGEAVARRGMPDRRLPSDAVVACLPENPGADKNCRSGRLSRLQMPNSGL